MKIESLKNIMIVSIAILPYMKYKAFMILKLLFNHAPKWAILWKINLKTKLWLNSKIRYLVNERRCTRDSTRRKGISLQLKRTWRREKRKFQNREFDKIIDEFKNLDRLQVAHETSIRKRMPKVRPHDQDFKLFWSSIFYTEQIKMNHDHIDFDALSRIEKFS